MANDVVIEVEARVGDAIAQMTLTAAAVRALGDEASSASAQVGTETDNRTLSGRLTGLRRTLGNMGDRGPLGMVVRGFGNLAAAMLAPIDLGLKFAQNFEQLGSVAQAFIGIGASLSIGLVGLAAAIAAVTFAATALATILGTLVAIAADFVAPVTLLGGLLGGLAAGFVVAAKRATEGGHRFKEFNDHLDTLGSMFHRTGTLLAQRFLPYFNELAGAAEIALNFLDKIIKLPLGQAFRMIDTQGTKLLGRFVDRVAEVLSKPIRLAFHVAFEDTAFSSMVSDWWHRFTGFLFGTVESHPIKLHRKTIGFEEHAVDGIFQPLIDWFNRHHFTRQGIVIGRQILNGVMNSGLRNRMSAFIVAVLSEAARQAASAFLRYFGRIASGVARLMGEVSHSIQSKISDAAGRASNAIIAALGHAWDWVKGKVSSVWSTIVGIVENPFNISINWPSPPSWFTSLLNGAGGLVSSIGHGATDIIPGHGSVAGLGGGSTTGGTFMPRTAMARGGGNTIIMRPGPLDSLASRRKVVAQIDRDLQQRWLRSGY